MQKKDTDEKLCFCQSYRGKYFKRKENSAKREIMSSKGLWNFLPDARQMNEIQNKISRKKNSLEILLGALTHTCNGDKEQYIQYLCKHANTNTRKMWQDHTRVLYLHCPTSRPPDCLLTDICTFIETSQEDVWSSLLFDSDYWIKMILFELL